MNRPAPGDPGFEAFRDRVDAYCDDRIGPEEFRLLEDELIANESARRYFVEYLRFHAELGFATRATRSASAALSRFDRQQAAAASPRRGRRIAAGRAAWIGLAAAAGLVGVGLVVIPRGGRMTTAITPTSPAAAPAAPAPANVAWLVNAQDCRWAEAPGRDMAAGRVLRLDRGLAEVEFDRGARVILQGPASLELLAADAARLLGGAMTAHVPAARGFAASTPGGHVVARGAEFGLAVDAAGAASVRVFDGELSAASSAPAASPVRVATGQQARLDGPAGRPRPDEPAVAREFARSILPPPLIRPRTLRLDFDRPVDGPIRDVEGFGIGLGRRLAGTGLALPGRDPNLRLRTDLGALELTTTRSDLNKQVGLDAGEYLGVALRDLGFTGVEDFAISVEVPNIPRLDEVGQFGLYAGASSNRAIRGGVLRQPEADRYSLFLVNNDGGIDRDVNEVGLTLTGDDLRFTLRRAGGKYSFLVENLTRHNSNTLTIEPSPFLDGVADLDVGIFGANAQSDLSKTLTIRRVVVTVFARLPAATAVARAAPWPPHR